jgi:thioredoxin-related protein
MERDGVLAMLGVAIVTAAFLFGGDASRVDGVRDPVTGIEVRGASVIMISKEGCPPCELMKKETLVDARADGYEVFVIEQKAERYPTTRIWNGREWRQRSGFFRWGDR